MNTDNPNITFKKQSVLNADFILSGYPKVILCIMYQIQTYEVIAGKTSLLVCLKQENSEVPRMSEYHLFWWGIHHLV